MMSILAHEENAQHDAKMPGKPPVQRPAFISQQITDARRFYFALRPRARSKLAVVCGGWEQCAVDYAINRRSFPYYSIEYVASGRGELELGRERHTLGPGLVFTYGPNIPHVIRSSRTDRLRKFFVDFTGSEAKKLLTQAGLAPGKVLKTGLPTEIHQAFDSLISTALSYDSFAEKAARLQLELLVISIMRGARGEIGSSPRAAAVFDRCRQYFLTHFRTLRTAEEAADACHIDVAYLTRLFRRFQDETPYRFLQRLQVQWAAERLQSAGCLVKTVADELKVDPFQFSRAFKRVYGISPSEFLAQRRAT